MRFRAGLWAIVLAASGCQFAIGALAPVGDDQGDAGGATADLSATVDGSGPSPDGGPITGDGSPAMPDATMGCSGDTECGGGTMKCCNAACVDTASHPANCGACGTACTAGPQQMAQCTMSACKATCAGDFADCNGLLTDGCEVDLGSDKNNCGACGNKCGGVCGSSLLAPMTAQPGAWNFNGGNQTCYWDKKALSGVLVDNQMFSAGSILYQNAIVTDSFDAKFDFQIGGGNGGDGMGFVLESDGNNRVGASGGGLGMAPLTGYGVEFDEFNNNQCGDNDANHIGVDSLAGCNGSSPTPLSPTVMPGFMLHGSGWHTCTLHFDMGKVTVALDGTKLIDAYSIQNFTPKSYYYGFTAGTGGNHDRFEVKNVEIDFPSPRCL